MQTIKAQIEEIYRLRHRDALAEAVKDDKFSLTDVNGNIILPSLWDQVVQAGATLQVVIPTEILNHEIAAAYPVTENIEVVIPPGTNPPSGASSTHADPTLDPWYVSDDEVVSSSESESSLDLESVSSSSETSDDSLSGKPEPAREATIPTDSDGNNLVFSVNTSSIRPLDHNQANATKAPNTRDPQQLVGNTDSISIGKANTAQNDGRTILQLHQLPGPKTTSINLDERMRWVHLRSEPMNLRGFRDTCLSIAGISGRLQDLVRKTFDKVEKEKLKVFIGGVFVEPGTVLRVDENCVPDPSSVIFSCVPYFDLQTSSMKKLTAGQALRAPSRSLMQSYYPFEPVDERDSEQAYRKFDNEKRGALVYVPNLWVMNIGSDIVATCSHQSLHEGFGQSIKLRNVDSDYTKDGLLGRDIRLTDWDGRQMIYNAAECRSFFQLEQKIKEMRREHHRSDSFRDARRLDLTWKIRDGKVKVTPGLWAGILCQRDSFYIDVILESGATKAMIGKHDVQPPVSHAALSRLFFNWPSKSNSDTTDMKSRPAEKSNTAAQCLDHVEKAMLSEVLSEYSLFGAVIEKAFTSTEYYRNLPQSTAEEVKSSFQALKSGMKAGDKSNKNYCSSHGTRIARYQKTIVEKAIELYALKYPEDSIVDYDQLRMEVWTKGCADILSEACQEAQQLYNSTKDLSDGVMNEDGEMSDLYTLPRSLLDAFRQLVVFYFAVERAMFYTQETFKDDAIKIEDQNPSSIDGVPFSSNDLQVIHMFGKGVWQALATTRKELCSMAKSPEPVNDFERLSLSPEYVCGWYMRRLIVKPLQNHMTVSDMYREYLSTIQFQVNHRPSKRLLRSINLLQEELAALQEVNYQQVKLVTNYISVLDDMTYKSDIPSRRAMFPYERLLLQSCQDFLGMTAQEYRYLLARCGPLSDSTKQSLEITEEDHGKAIMVFTIVTVIFLPLSFVTSFLGMNTTDIRDMGSSSSLFWSIAIPLTAITMASVLYIGYNGDDLRDFFDMLYRTATGKQSRSAGARGISVAQRTLARKQTNASRMKQSLRIHDQKLIIILLEQSRPNTHSE
ncbi:hypothetical protein G6514_001505 [Epicoccum nigrum]|nr:hypothetical protein G6514_001505 [Epicoccum nigrum]